MYYTIYRIYHTPGHTMDHIVISLEEDGALFSADSVLGEGSTVFDDLTEYLKSLQLILDLKPTVIFPGHGSVIKVMYIVSMYIYICIIYSISYILVMCIKNL